MGKKHLTDAQRGEIVQLRNHGISISRITQTYKISRSTVWRIVNRHQLTDTSAQKFSPGRPLKMSQRQQRYLKRLVVRDRHHTLLSLVSAMFEASGVKFSKNTIRRYLRKLGYHCYMAIKKPLLKPCHIRARLKWCKARLKWNMEWDGVIFSDEASVKQYPCGRIRVYRREDEKYAIDCIHPKVHSDGFSIMVWEMFTKSNIFPVVMVSG